MDRADVQLIGDNKIWIKVLDGSNPFQKLWLKFETFNQINLDVQVKLTS